MTVTGTQPCRKRRDRLRAWRAQQGHYPFGETWYAVSATTKWQFSSYERDTESGNDYAIFRYHVNRLRRFNSPDPLPGSLANPQSFNRYAYARNDPSNLTDPSGLATSFWEWIFSAENGSSFGGGSGILLAAQDYSLRESCGDRYYDLPSLFPRAAQQAEAEHTNRVTEAFLGQSLRETAQRQKDKLCAAALKTAGQNMSAVDRANAAWDTLQAAADANSIDPALLAAIGIRESGFQNVSEKDGAGVGVGVFQITVSSTSGVTAAQAGNLTWAANYAANMLGSNMDYLGGKFPNFTPAQVLQATAASYNMNPYKPGNFTGNPNTIDVGTAHNNYGSNVVELMNCF